MSNARRRIRLGIVRALSLTYWKQLLALAVGYWLGGELGLLVGSGYDGVSPLWPPAGIALFAFLVVGRRLWPGVVLGAVLLAYTGGTGWGMSLVIAAASMVEAMLAVYLLRQPRTDFKFGMQRVKDVLLLTGCAAIGAATMGSMFGAFTMALLDLASWADVRVIWFTWWLGDAVGIIVITPLLLVWRRWRQVRPNARQLTELALLLSAVAVTAWLNFYLIAEHQLNIPLVFYLMLPFAILTAARFRQHGATLVAMLVCVVMLWGTQHGYGAFEPYSGLDRLLLSIFYIAMTAFTALCVAALFAERWHTEKALFASREQYRTLVGTMNEGLGVQDKNGVVTYVNDRFCEIVGYGREEIVGKPVTAHIGEINQALWLELVSARRFGKTEPYELEVRRKDGRRIYLQVSPQLIFDEDGEPAGSFAVYTDITQRKRIETTLSGRREVLERLATGAPLAEVLTTLAETAEDARPDMRCSVMIVEDGRLRIGAAPSLPGYYVDALHGVEVGSGHGAAAAAVCTGMRVIVEDVLTHPYWYAYRGLARRAGVRSCWSEPIISSRGEILGAFTMYHREPRRPEQSDLLFMAATVRVAAVAIEQRRKEEALRQSEERFRQLAEHIRDVFWMTDADGTWRYISPAYARVWGRSLQSLYDDPDSWIEAIHPDDRKRIGHNFFTKVPQGDSEQEYRVVLPDGSIRWIRDRAFAIRNEAGEVYRVAGIAEDVTEDKLATQQTREHQDELAHMARLSSVGEMASSLAHELNQPLGAVTNYCKAGLRLLRGGGERERIAEALEKASTQAQRAGDIIHHIRDFVRKDTRRRAYVELNDIVREAVRLTEADIRKKRCSIRLKLSERLPRVIGDRIQLEQVILNLLRNGTEAMVDCNAQKRELVVFSRVLDGRMVRISVRDCGAGLDDETMKRIFDPFYTTKSDGMGMGLPISRSIIEAHAGHLWAEQRVPPGSGATFHFTLPISRGCEA
ncbi:MAG: PAS domain S-box protein [Gammaproteobacteria bacterium]